MGHVAIFRCRSSTDRYDPSYECESRMCAYKPTWQLGLFSNHHSSSPFLFPCPIAAGSNTTQGYTNTTQHEVHRRNSSPGGRPLCHSCAGSASTRLQTVQRPRFAPPDQYSMAGVFPRARRRKARCIASRTTSLVARAIILRVQRHPEA